MRNFLSSFVVLSVFVTSAFCEPGVIARASRAIPNRYIVVFDNAKVSDAASAAEDMISRNGVKKELVYEGAMRGFAFTGTEAAAIAISKDPRVKWVEEDSEIVGAVLQNPSPSWGLDRIDQQVAVNRDVSGNWIPGQYSASYMGAGTVIYVLDSGVNPITSEFGSRIREAHNWALGPGGSGPDPNYTTDCYGHGTRVASVAAGTTYGVAKSASIVNLRVLDCTNAYSNSSTVIAGVNWMVNDHINNHSNEPAIANMSLGSTSGTDLALDTAVINALHSGITVVTSAGNSANDACTHSPSHLGNPNQLPSPDGSSIITVGATDLSDTFASYSNYGSCVDLLAPGSYVQEMTASGSPDNSWTGTSFSSPFVAGVAALHMEHYGIANGPATIEGVIHDNATANAVSGVPTGTPNLILWNGVGRRHICCS